MRNFTFLLVAAFICSLSFGQLDPNKVIKLDKPVNNEAKSGWVGYTNALYSAYLLSEGRSYYSHTSAFVQPGEVIEEIAFFHYYGQATAGEQVLEGTCTSYTISIFVDPVFIIGVPMWGTAEYTQVVDGDLINGAINRIVLDTPYEMPEDADVYVGIKMNNGAGFVGLGDPAYDSEAGDHYLVDQLLYFVWASMPLSDGTNTYPLTVRYKINDGEPYQARVDIEPLFANSFNQRPTFITELRLTNTTSNLVVYPVIMNNGPDDAEGSIEVEYLLNNVLYDSDSFGFEEPFEDGAGSFLYQNGAYTIPASALNERNLYGNFELKMKIRYSGEEIEFSDNNEVVLSITRPTIGIADITIDSFSIFPNPSKGEVNVSVTENSTVKVYDVTGKLVNTANVTAGETFTFKQPTGMYFVNVNGKVQKVVIE